MTAVTFDDIYLNAPSELMKNPEFSRWVSILARLSQRTGGSAVDKVDQLDTAISNNSVSIVTLEETVEEIEELLALQKQNLDTSINELKVIIRQIQELKETD